LSEKPKNDDRQEREGGFVGMYKDHMDAHRRRSRAVAIVIIGGMGALVAISIVVGFIILAVESAAVNSTYGETIAGLCRNMPMGEPDMANLPAPDGPTQLLLLRAGSQQRHRWHGELPVGWRAETGDEVGMVGCVLVDDEEIESCDYQRPDPEGGTYTVSIERMQTTASITLLNPTTGERVAERVVLGSEPDPCPPDSEDLNVAQQIEGSEPTSADFSDWLERFVDGTAG